MTESTAYPSGAIEHLCAADPVLAELITRYGIVTRDRSRPPFYALMAAIVGQQISVKAAAAIMGRLLGLFAEGQSVEAAALADVSFEQLRAVGLSAAKARYLHDLAEKVADGTVDLAALPQLPDEEVITTLCQVKGIGRWTAEMFLIFSLAGSTCWRWMIWGYAPVFSAPMGSTSCRVRPRFARWLCLGGHIAQLRRFISGSICITRR